MKQNTIKRHFYVREKIMRIGQNGPLDKFTRFLFMRLNVPCIVIYIVWRDKNLCETNLCDCHLTRIIHVNKTRAEKCTFTVILQESIS
jgi:hypothetical protein